MTIQRDADYNWDLLTALSPNAVCYLLEVLSSFTPEASEAELHKRLTLMFVKLVAPKMSYTVSNA